MCGIAGFIDKSGALRADGQLESLRAMVSRLHHRGPDSSGTWQDAPAGLNLGHARLAIVDLTPSGAQPMLSADGRWVIVFNGEIYNFQELRDSLRACGHKFTGTSDTEVLLAGAVEWGVRETLGRCVGMFALAIYDRRERELHLARDRMGEKPLYYGWAKGVFLFASELKALRAHPAWTGDVDRGALQAYFRHSFIPAPASIFKGIHKLLPGSLLTLSLGRLDPVDCGQPVRYWSVIEQVKAGQAAPFAGSDTEAVEELGRLLKRAVGQQMVADVPLGAFLSGGIDSSAIVALMQSQSPRPVKTFTIGFGEADYNEAPHAAAVARHLGTEHTEMYVTPADALAVIPRIPEIYDEPFADSSQIPTYLVSALARKHVTVSLSGDAGDELFGGYRRYSDALTIWRKMVRVPAILRRPAAQVIGLADAPTWEKGLGWLLPLMAGQGWRGRTGDRLHKLARLFKQPDSLALYLRLICRDPEAAAMVLGGEPRQLEIERAAQEILGTSAGLITQMTYLDMVSYLPDCILTKVDRAGMAVSLEGRIPLLDHRVVEFACRLPDRCKIRDGQGKWILRQLLYQHVPRELIERPKMGFGVPIEQWLRGPLRDWAENLLDENRLRQEGFLDPEPIRRKWAEHLSGARRWHYYLWDVLMFQAWLEAQGPAVKSGRGAT